MEKQLLYIKGASDQVPIGNPVKWIGKVDNYFKGKMDEVRIWNIARTEAEIQASMNTSLTGNEAGLVGYWNFDDGTAKDLTANGNDGEFKGDAKTIETVLGGVGIPDPNLRVALNKALGKNEGDAITKEDLEGLKELDAEGLSITDISMLKYTPSLTQLNLKDNQITDISPLIENTGISGAIKLKTNPLNNTALSTHIPALEARGITVEYDMPEDVLLFKDANLEKAIRDALKIPTELLKKEDLAKLTELIVDGNVPWGSSLTEQEQIKDLVGLEHCVSLTQLNLRNHQINDISALANLTKLSNIELSFNQLSDISPLSNLTNLKKLELWGNQLSDISPLSNLTNLTNLSLWNNQISDINPLANLTSLTQLNLNHNNLSEVSQLSNLTNLINLTYLALYLNQITDISPLSKLTSLKNLELHGNKISDISPLVENAGISGNIDLRDNPLNNTALSTHIPTLKARGITVEYDMPEGVVLFKDANLEKAIRDAAQSG